MINFILPKQGDAPNADVIPIKVVDDIGGCRALTSENMHIFVFECSIKGYFT